MHIYERVYKYEFCAFMHIDRHARSRIKMTKKHGGARDNTDHALIVRVITYATDTHLR